MGKELREDMRRGHFILFVRKDTICYEFYAIKCKITVRELHEILGLFHRDRNTRDTISKHH
jgi:hypothetical protein